MSHSLPLSFPPPFISTPIIPTIYCSSIVCCCVNIDTFSNDNFFHQIVKTFLLICAIGLCAAVEKSCPPDSTGEYPKCLCNNFDFIFKDNACVKVNREECPSPAIKVDGKVGCRCPDPTDFFDDYYWFCRTKLYLPTPTPSTTTTVRPTIRTCPAYHRGTWPDCVRIPCGDDQPGRYAPDCVHVTFRPVTYTPVKVCPHPQVGSYPHCQYPCPPHTTREFSFNSSKF